MTLVKRILKSCSSVLERLPTRDRQGLPWLGVWLARVTLMLVVLGLAMRLSCMTARRDASEARIVGSELATLAVAVLLAIAVGRIGAGRIISKSRVVVATAAVLYLSLSIGGALLWPMVRPWNLARMWQDFGVPGVQPSEILRVSLVLWLAKLYARRGLGRDCLGLAIGLCAAAFVSREEGLSAVTVTIAIQPSVMLFLAGRSWGRMVAAIVLPTLTLAVVLAVGADYQTSRLISFLSGYDPHTVNAFRPKQAKIAMGSGGVWGRGLGESRQKLGYLPGADSDFIGAILCEELGLLGFAAVLLSFLFIGACGLAIGVRQTLPENRLAAYGCTFVIVWPAILHLATCTGLAPVMEARLPFFSRGGTTLLTCLASVSVLLSLAKNTSGQATPLGSASALNPDGTGHRVPWGQR